MTKDQLLEHRLIIIKHFYEKLNSEIEKNKELTQQLRKGFKL